MSPAIAILALTTQIVLLGTGDTWSAPQRAGPATAIVVDGSAYLVDFGPGIVRRAAIASQKGIAALDPANLTHAFATQLSSERTAGYPDLIFTPWLRGRKLPLEVYGPPGIVDMTEHVLAAWSDEVQGRRVNAHEIRPGVVFRDAKITVISFDGGYRFQTADRRIVIAFGTNPHDSSVGQCSGCDVLMHEVNMRSARPLGNLAARARPELLILRRAGEASEELLIRELRTAYGGRVIVGEDLDVL